MHLESKQFMESIKQIFPQFFTGCRVLDVGSQDINGNNRYLFDDTTEYVGLDLGPGINVDIVCHAADYQTKMPFDLVISTNALEHDSRYAESLNAMAGRLLRPGGLMVVCCAAEGTPVHGTHEHYSNCSPHTLDYYKNLSKEDFTDAISDIDSIFCAYSLCYFGVDLRFWGLKRERAEW